MASQPVLTVQGRPLLARVFLFPYRRTYRMGPNILTPVRLRSPYRSFPVDPRSCYFFGEIAFGGMSPLLT